MGLAFWSIVGLINFVGLVVNAANGSFLLAMLCGLGTLASVHAIEQEIEK